MALVVKDRVKVTTNTTGTGTLTLGSAVTKFQDFSVIGDGNTTYYAIESGNGTDWEVGIGTYTASGTTLSRDTILESSNAGSAINLSGTSFVFCTYPAEKSVNTDDIGSTIQAYDADLTTLGGLAKTDGNFIVGDGTTWVTESGATARTSLGLGSLATLSSVDAATITDNSVGAAELNVSGNGTTSQFLRSDGDGTFTWAEPVGGTGPAFSAYLSSSQTPSLSTSTKIQCDTEVFDTNSNYDNATNYRFTPTVAGYYQVNAKFRGNISTTTTSINVYIYKNGAIYDTLARSLVDNANLQTLSVSSLIYMNGSTDYIEFYVNMQGTGTPTIYGDALYRNACNFNAVLVRTD